MECCYDRPNLVLLGGKDSSDILELSSWKSLKESQTNGKRLSGFVAVFLNSWVVQKSGYLRKGWAMEQLLPIAPVTGEWGLGDGWDRTWRCP